MRNLILILFLLFCSNFVFAQDNPQPNCPTRAYLGCLASSQLSQWSLTCQSNDGYIAVPSAESCPADTTGMKCARTSSCTCPSGYAFNVVINASGVHIPGCVSDDPTSGGDTCPGGVKNISTGVCEPKTECAYPALYDMYNNGCMPNPNNCAIGAKPNPLEPGSCMATGETSCPSGWSSGDANNCVANPSSTGSNTSAGSNTSTATNTSTGSNTSTATNTSTPSGGGDDGGDDGGSGSGGSGNGGGGSDGGSGSGGGSNTSSGSNTSWTPHSGYGNWIPIAEGSPCPNKYQDTAGQWWCSAANSGSNSSGAGQCDPTAKDYLACISQGASGTGSSSGANSSACNPSAADYKECIAGQQGSGKTKELTDKFNQDMDKERDKFNKAIDDDLGNFQRDGLTFKDQPGIIRGALIRLLPVSTSCSPPSLLLFSNTYTLDCFYFDIFKQAFGWFLAILTAYQIWNLAVRPVDR